MERCSKLAGGTILGYLVLLRREKSFYVGTFVIVETGVMCGMQLLFVESNTSAVEMVETGLRCVAGGNGRKKRNRE